jgi:hypothetical protein
MSGLPDTRAVSISTAGYEDGLGRRSVRFDREVGGMLECLHLRAELWAFESGLRDAANAIASLEDERFVRIRAIERDPFGLTVVSEVVAGQRLLDIIDTRQRDDGAPFGVDASIGFLLQALPALATLHTLSIAHGALAPGRILVTGAGQIVLLDGIYGAALERLNLSRVSMWTNFGILSQPFVGAPRFDRQADLRQAGLCGLMLAVGSAVSAPGDPSSLAPLLDELREVAEIRAGASFAARVLSFFESLLAPANRRAVLTADTAAAELETLAEMIGEEGCHTAFAQLARVDANVVRSVRQPVEAFVELDAMGSDEELEELPEELPVEEVLRQKPEEHVTGPVSRATVPPARAVEAPLPTPSTIVQPPLPPPVPAEPIPAAGSVPVIPVTPAVAAFSPAPGPPLVTPVPAFAPPGVSVTPIPQPVPPPAPPKLVPPVQPVFAAPVQPVFAPPVQPAIAPTPPTVVAPSPMTTAAATAAPNIGLAPVAPVTLKVRQEPPAGFTPARGEPEPAVRALPFVDRAVPAIPSAFPWKLAAAAVIVLAVGIAGGRTYLQSNPDITPSIDPPKPAPSAAPAPTTGMTGTLAIDTQPSGAKITLDGIDVGVAPLKLDSVQPGKHVVVVTTETATIRRTVRVEAGRMISLDVPVYSGWVSVFSPIPLEVAEAGKTLGNTDTGKILLPPGRHELTLSNTEFGFSDTRTVEIQPGEERPLNVEPKGVVNVNAHPWAEVWIDGKKAGDTPIANLAVLMGTRIFTFKHPQYGERRLTVTVTSTAAAVSVDFTKP